MTFVCGFVCMLMYQCVEARSMQRQKFPFFQLTTAVSNHSAASSVHTRPLKVYIVQLCRTYTSS